MRIQITPDGYITQDSDAPIVGRSYYLEDATSGTTAQNKAFHALITEYFKSGCSSYEAKSYDDFRNDIKRRLGAGFVAFVYAVIENGKPRILDAAKYTDIPLEVKNDPDMRQLIRGRLKSWTDYTKKERQATMDKLIAEMHQVGVTTKKFYQILEGMEK
jgi:hypothetical protein